MINKETAIVRGLMSISDLFGFEYVQKHKTAPYCYSYRGEDVLRVSFLFQNAKERPDIEANHLGWAVFATVDVDLRSGEITVVNGIMPDGSAIEK